MLQISTEQDAVLLPVKVVPGASRTAFVGEWDGRAKLTIAAPPEKGRANKEIVVYLAKLLGLRRRDVSVVRGLTTPLKTIRIEGVTVGAVRAALQPTRS